MSPIRLSRSSRRAGSIQSKSRAHKKLRAAVEAMESRVLLSAFVVNTVADQVDPPGSATVSLRDAVNLANNSTAAATITFDPKVFATSKTITLTTNTSLELSNVKASITITGPAVGVKVDGNGATDIMVVDKSVNATIAGMTLSHGASAIANAGNLTVQRSILSNNFNGLRNRGKLNLQNSTISGNSGHTGGGLFNGGDATITACTFSENTASYYEYSDPIGRGGAVANTGKLTITNSTLSGNHAQFGGAIENSGTVAITNSTVSGNSAVFGGDDGFKGDAIENQGEVILANDIVADLLDGGFTSLGHNLISKKDGSNGWISTDLTGTAAHPLDPQLSPLGNYGGLTATQFPLAGSPAIGAGAVARIPAGVTKDQRGFARVVGGKVDIGAVELQKVSVVTVAPPAAQSVVAGRSTSIKLGTFSDPGGKGPFAVTVNWGDGSAPETFPVAAIGSLGAPAHTFNDTLTFKVTATAFDASGDVSQPKSFSVSASAAPLVTFTVNTTSDQTDPAGSRTVSLRDAVNMANAAFGPATIQFSPTVFAGAKTITLATPLFLTGNHFGLISIHGPAAGVTLAGEGGVIVENGNASISNLVVTTDGISNYGTLTATHISAHAKYGGSYGQPGIVNGGMMTLVDSTISGNSGPKSAIQNQGTFAIIGDTISQNAATGNYYSPGIAGGIQNYGKLTITNSTVSGNTSASGSGGIESTSDSLTTIINSTIVGNTSASGAGGVEEAGSGGISLINCTVYGNKGTTGGGIFNDSSSNGRITLGNTIVSSNSATSSGPDVSGAINSLGHNLIRTRDGSSGWISSDLTGTMLHPIDPKLSLLVYHGGPTQTMVPVAGSPAIGAGSIALIPAGVITDQRGLPRTIGGRVDIGAVEIDKGGPFFGNPAAFGSIQAENFDFGGQNVAYFNPSNNNPGRAYRPNEGIGIASISGVGTVVGYTSPGEWINYTVKVTATGTYTLNFRVSSGTPGCAFHLEVDGVNVTGKLAIPNQGWIHYVTVSKTGVHLTAGTHVLRLVIDSKNPTQGNGNYDWIQAVKTG